MRYLLVGLAILFLAAKPADAHFFGATQDIDGYQVIFAPFPSSPVVGNDLTLNFSVLEDGENLYNVYVSVTVANKSTAERILQSPYRQYEISDITIPYIFSEPGQYEVTISTRILEHEKYQAQPLVATFDLTVFSQGMPLEELFLYYVAPAAVVIAGIAIYMYSKNMI